MRGLTEGSSGTDVLAPFSRKPRKMPLSFEGLQEVGLVRFDDPGLVPGHDRLGKGPESMPPVEGGFPVDPATPGRLSDRFSLVHPFHVVEPAVLVAKARQRGLRQRSEGPQTPLTPVSRESGGITPRPDLVMVAMGAGAAGRWDERVPLLRRERFERTGIGSEGENPCRRHAPVVPQTDFRVQPFFCGKAGPRALTKAYKSDADFAQVAGVELTLLYCARYFHKAAGINGVAQIAKDIGAKAEPRALAKAAAAYENSSVRRLGYLLERAGHTRQANALESLVKKASPAFDSS